MKNLVPWDILIKYFKHEASSEEEVRIREWLSDAKNRTLFDELHSLWLLLMLEGSEYVSQADELWKRMEARMVPAKSAKRTPLLRPLGRKVSRIAAAVLVLLLAGGGILALQYNARYISESYSTVGEKSEILLPDGSVVWLNANTQLTYSSSLFSNKRKVALDGEALFDVVKDGAHPFIVSSGDVRVRVLGTRFNVEAYSGGDDITVCLISGSVSIGTPSGEEVICPGEKALYNTKTEGLEIMESDIELESAWASETLSLNQLSLRQVSVYLSQWYNLSINVSAEIPDTQSYTLIVDKDDSIEDILKLLSGISEFHYRFTDDGNVEIFH